MMSVPGGGRSELRVRLTAEVASVPGARRSVSDGLLEWGHHSGSPYMQVRLRDLEPGVRLGVEDDGALVPVPASAPPPVESHGTTGRGLAIVSVLAKSWGIEGSSTMYDLRW